MTRNVGYFGTAPLGLSLFWTVFTGKTGNIPVVGSELKKRGLLGGVPLQLV
jgi:hypothetical protein